MFCCHTNPNEWFAFSASLTFLDMVQLEQYDASPIVTVDTDANTEVNLKFSCDKFL